MKNQQQVMNLGAELAWVKIMQEEAALKSVVEHAHLHAAVKNWLSSLPADSEVSSVVITGVYDERDNEHGGVDGWIENHISVFLEGGTVELTHKGEFDFLGDGELGGLMRWYLDENNTEMNALFEAVESLKDVLKEHRGVLSDGEVLTVVWEGIE